MHKRIYLSIVFLLVVTLALRAQGITLSGQVVDEESGKPVEFASLLMKENGLWAISDAKGAFRIKNVPKGNAVLTIQCMGYATRTLPLVITKDIPRMRILLKQENLKLDEVTVTAKRKTDEATTSFSIDRTALDQQQIVNVGDIATLLPGGKTVNPTLTSDNRMALRSGEQEKGNASFGTAIEVDGMRISNNAAAGETSGASTRTISSSNIESVEVVTGIPSVEYGDLSNGIVKVNTRKGKSPFIIEGKINQHTRQIALNKGFDLGGHHGVLNTSFEHARSFTDAASPHTAYQRNILTLNYMNIFMRESMPLTLNAGLTANIGGYSSDSDPDEELGDYVKARDHALRAHFELNWLLNKRWITNLSLRGSLAYSDRRQESYLHASSASTQPYIHAMEEGYNMSANYDDNPQANIILGPTGYWHVRSYNDSKPLNYSLRLKGDWSHRFGTMLNRLMVGAEWTASRNNGRGNYYDDLRYTPTWREYRYDELPTLNNVALYAEEKVSIPTGKQSSFELTAGLRNDITVISSSDYGTVSSVSPRVNSRYIFWKNKRNRWVSNLSLHAGWGKSVKLPSFQVLYPSPSYRDMLAFSSPSTTDNTSHYAYYTHPSSAVYNPALKWQYTNQTDIGFEMTIKGTRIAVSAFHHRTHHPYMSEKLYTPFTYYYTAPAALDGIAIDAANRLYTINQQTGVVTVSDATGAQAAVPLANTGRDTYLSNTRYRNGSSLDRYGLEWTVDFKQIKALRTSIRLDGNYYYYKGLDDVLFADIPLSNATMSDGQPYRYVGYYRGSNSTSAGSLATATVSNGSLSKQLSMNATITTHIPRIRLIVSLRLECSLYNYRRPLSELGSSTRGIVLSDKADFISTTPYDGKGENQYVALYPEYYSTWDNPNGLIPFAEKFKGAYETMNNPNATDDERAAAAVLYNDLSKLVVKSNYAYTLNADRLSSYYSANFSVTKEIGDHVRISFYANNFFNNMKTVHSSQTGLDTSLFSSSYIPSFYYGLSLKLKL